MRGLGPPYPPLNELRRRDNELLRRDSGEGRAKPSVSTRLSGDGVEAAWVRRTCCEPMWAQNTLLIETANACDVARCGVAM